MTDANEPELNLPDDLTVKQFQVIRDLSKEELIDEILADFRLDLQKQSEEELRHNVMHTRLDAVRKRMLVEAGFDPDHPPCDTHRGPLGFLFGH